MSKDWRASFRYRVAIDLVDASGRGRSGEPVEVTLTFPIYRPAGDGIVIVHQRIGG